MTLVDTTDGVLMLGAYQWAFVNPLRKLYYNLAITSISVVVAVLIGGVELLGLLADRFGLAGGFWGFAQVVGAHLNELGFALVAVLVVTWIGSVALWRHKRFDAVELERRS
jgi:high-affinity nickel-transport protein